MTSTILSQTITKDSVTIHKETFKNIMRDVEKGKFYKTQLDKKDENIYDLAQKLMNSYTDFQEERAEKEETQKLLIEAKEELTSYDKRRFSFTISAGPVLTSDSEIKPGVMVGVSYTLFRL